MGYQVFLRIIRCIKLNAEICRITASRPLRFNYIENQIFVTLKQQPVLSLLTPAGRSSVESPEPQLAAQIGLFLQTLQ